MTQQRISEIEASIAASEAKLAAALDAGACARNELEGDKNTILKLETQLNDVESSALESAKHLLEHKECVASLQAEVDALKASEVLLHHR